MSLSFSKNLFWVNTAFKNPFLITLRSSLFNTKFIAFFNVFLFVLISNIFLREYLATILNILDKGGQNE